MALPPYLQPTEVEGKVEAAFATSSGAEVNMVEVGGKGEAAFVASSKAKVTGTEVGGKVEASITTPAKEEIIVHSSAVAAIGP